MSVSVSKWSFTLMSTPVTRKKHTSNQNISLIHCYDLNVGIAK